MPAELQSFNSAPKSVAFLRQAETACIAYLNSMKPLHKLYTGYVWTFEALFKELKPVDLHRHVGRNDVNLAKYLQTKDPQKLQQIRNFWIGLHPAFAKTEFSSEITHKLLWEVLLDGSAFDRRILFPKFMAPLLTHFEQLEANVANIRSILQQISALMPLAQEVARISTVAADANQQVSILTGQLADTRQRALVTAQQAADALAAFKQETAVAAAQTAAANRQALDALQNTHAQQLAAAAQQAAQNVTNLQTRHAQEMAAAAQTAATALANLRTENVAQAAATAQQTATTLANLRAQHAQQLAAAEQRAAQALDNLRAQNTQAAAAAAKQAADELAALRSDFAAQAAAATEKAALEAAAAAQVLSEAQAERDAVNADLKKANANLQKAQSEGKTLRTLLYAAAVVGAVYVYTSQ